MKGLVVYSSNTGNTKKLATEIYNGVKDLGEWTLEDVKNSPDAAEYDVVLLGGWAEGGSLDKSSLKFFEGLDKASKKIGLFITMGSRTSTDHGKFCEGNVRGLLEGCNSLGVQLAQGKVSPELMAKLEKMPESALPESVKVAMRDGVENYKELTKQEYQIIADFYGNQLR